MIQHIPNVSDSGGSISVQDYFTGVSTQIVLPGSGAFDDSYFPVALEGQTIGDGFEQDDSANLDPMIAMEAGETVNNHRHRLRNLKLDGNYANNTSGKAVAAVEPSGYSGSLLEPMIENCWVVYWPDDIVDFSLADTPTITDSAVAYSNNGDGIKLNNGYAHGLTCHDAGARGVVMQNDAFVLGRVYDHGSHGVEMAGTDSNFYGEIYRCGGDGARMSSQNNAIYGTVRDNNGNGVYATARRNTGFVTSHSNGDAGVRMDGENIVFFGRSWGNNYGVAFEKYFCSFWGEMHDNTNRMDYADANVVNGYCSRAANAETPDASLFPVGTLFDFEDSGDGSGTGYYLSSPQAPNDFYKFGGSEV
jgi:hypothetical protein